MSIHDRHEAELINKHVNPETDNEDMTAVCPECGNDFFTDGVPEEFDFGLYCSKQCDDAAYRKYLSSQVP